MNDSEKVAEATGKDQSHWVGIIEAVRTPLGFYALIVLASEAIMAVVLPFTQGFDRTLLLFGMLGMVGVLIGVVSFFAYTKPEALGGLRASSVGNGEQTDTRRPRDEMRLQIRANTDEAFELIDTKSHDDSFALFMEAKSKLKYTELAGLTEDSASLRISAVREKINALFVAEEEAHRKFELAITPQEIERIEKRLEVMIVADTIDLYGGEFLVYRPLTEAEWEAEQERRGQHLDRLRREIVLQIEKLKEEFSGGD